jgi:hypothetical protein
VRACESAVAVRKALFYGVSHNTRGIFTRPCDTSCAAGSASHPDAHQHPQLFRPHRRAVPALRFWPAEAPFSGNFARTPSHTSAFKRVRVRFENRTLYDTILVIPSLIASAGILRLGHRGAFEGSMLLLFMCSWLSAALASLVHLQLLTLAIALLGSLQLAASLREEVRSQNPAR